MLDPTGGRMQMPVEMLEGSPFINYLIPGLILCIVLGLGAFFVLASLLILPDWGWAQRLNPVKSQHWTWAAGVYALVPDGRWRASALRAAVFRDLESCP